MELSKNYKRELQLKILDIVKDIDSLCKENNIQYYLLYGSALGAIRHGGFIPWDDDFDIGMTYDNYEKFLVACEEQLDKSKYYIQTLEKENDYYLSFAKVRDITTTLIEEGNKNVNIVRSVSVDVFPLVGVPNSKLNQLVLKLNRAFMLSANLNVINNRVLKSVFDVMLKIVGKEKILKYTTKKCFKYSCKDSDYWCSIADGDGFEYNTMNKMIYGKPKYVKFEDTKLPVPEKTDKYLQNMYGDYLKIPSEEQIKQKEHKPYYLNLNLPYLDYMKSKEKVK